MTHAFTYSETSQDLIQYFIKLSDLLKSAEDRDLATLKLGSKTISVLDLKKCLFNLLKSVKLEMFEYHKNKDTQYSKEEISFIEGLAKYEHFLSLHQEYHYNKLTASLGHILTAFLALFKSSIDSSFISDFSIFGLARFMDFSSNPYDKLKADLDMLHTSEQYSDYLAGSRNFEDEDSKIGVFENELSTEYLIPNVDAVEF